MQDRCGRCSRRNRRRRHPGAADQSGQGVFPRSRVNGTKRRLVEYYLAVGGGPMLDRAARPAHPSAALPGRNRRRGDLPEAGTAAPPRLPGDLPGDVPVGTHRRRAEGHPPGSDRVGGADGHDHAAPVAGALPGHRASRRVAHRSGSTAGHRLWAGAGGRRRGAAAAARRTRLGRVPEDIRGRGIHVSCASPPTGGSSRCAARASHWPAKWSAARRTR